MHSEPLSASAVCMAGLARASDRSRVAGSYSRTGIRCLSVCNRFRSYTVLAVLWWPQRRPAGRLIKRERGGVQGGGRPSRISDMRDERLVDFSVRLKGIVLFTVTSDLDASSEAIKQGDKDIATLYSCQHLLGSTRYPKCPAREISKRARTMGLPLPKRRRKQPRLCIQLQR